MASKQIHFRKIRPVEILVLASYMLVIISIFLLNNSWDSGLSAFGLFAIFITSILSLYRLRSFSFVLWPFNLAIGVALGFLIKLSGAAAYSATSSGATFLIHTAPLAKIMALFLSGVIFIYLIFTFFLAKKDFFKSMLLIFLACGVGWLMIFFDQK